MSIGCVVYTKESETGILIAKWTSLKESGIKTGTGNAMGAKGSQFEGDYQIQYYNNAGEPTSKFDLKIEKNNEKYLIYWIQNEEVKYYGIGQIENGKLIAGWRVKED